METLIKPKLTGRGGPGRGGGRKLGVKSKEKLSQIKTKEEALELFQKRAFGMTNKILNAQMIVAQGSHKMIRTKRVNGILKTEQVTDIDTIQDLLDNGVNGEDYEIVVGALPDFRAGDAILNRALGKPTEVIEMSGRDGAPLLIKLNE